MHSIPFLKGASRFPYYIFWNKYGMSSIELGVLSEKGSISLSLHLDVLYFFGRVRHPLKKVFDDFMND